jgi:predicted DCC family thiol-disulfide oxidoreductase YuxK
VEKGNYILYDGCCNLCDLAMKGIYRYDKAGYFSCIPIQSEKGRQFIQKYQTDLNIPDSVILIQENEIYTRSEAFFRIVRHLRGLIRFFLIFSLLPRRFTDAIFDLLARNRFRWFGRRCQCENLVTFGDSIYNGNNKGN